LSPSRVLVWSLLALGSAEATAAAAPEEEPSALEDGDDEAVTRARELFTSANEALDAGDPERALALFRASRAAAPSRYNRQGIAFCLDALDRLDEAAEAYRELVSAHGDALPADVREAVDARLEALTRQLVALRVAGPRGAVVELDGAVRATLPLAQPIVVLVGEHRVRVLQGDTVLLDRIVSGGPGDVRAVEVASTPPSRVPSPLPLPARKAPAEQEPDSSIAWVAGWVATAVGVTALGVGGYFGVRAIQKKEESDALLVDGRCPAPCFDAWEDGRRSATVANGLVISGAVATATGITLVIVGAGDRGGRRHVAMGVSWPW
jgi:hypothetical protein